MYSLNGGRKDPINLLHRYNTYRRYTYKERQNFLKYKIYVIIVREFQIREQRVNEKLSKERIQ